MCVSVYLLRHVRGAAALLWPLAAVSCAVLWSAFAAATFRMPSVQQRDMFSKPSMDFNMIPTLLRFIRGCVPFLCLPINLHSGGLFSAPASILGAWQLSLRRCAYHLAQFLSRLASNRSLSGRQESLRGLVRLSEALSALSVIFGLSAPGSFL